MGECRQLRARVISLTPVVPDIAARTGGSISFGYVQICCQLSQLTLMGNVIDVGIVQLPQDACCPACRLEAAADGWQGIAAQLDRSDGQRCIDMVLCTCRSLRTRCEMLLLGKFDRQFQGRGKVMRKIRRGSPGTFLSEAGISWLAARLMITLLFVAGCAMSPAARAYTSMQQAMATCQATLPAYAGHNYCAPGYGVGWIGNPPGPHAFMRPVGQSRLHVAAWGFGCPSEEKWSRRAGRCVQKDGPPEYPLPGLEDPETGEYGSPKSDSNCLIAGGNGSNPIDSATGNKRQHEVDFVGAGVFR